MSTQPISCYWMSSIVLLNRNFFRLLYIFLVSFVVVSCTTIQTDTSVEPSTGEPFSDASEETWSKRQFELSSIKYWRLTGRLAVSQGEEAWNINIDWQQKDQDYEIVLNGPFGLGKVKLNGNPYGVILKDSDEQVFYADKPETLLFEQTGVTMPVEGLRYWVVGLTSPDQQQTPRLDQRGRLSYLEDEQWKVKFKRYVQVSGIDLPRKVFIVEPDRDIDVRLVVDKWKLGAF